MKRQYKPKTTEDYLRESEIARLERQKVIPYDYELKSCKNKAQFSHEVAIKKAKYYGQFYYKCNICGCYHLTSHPTYESIMEEL